MRVLVGHSFHRGTGQTTMLANMAAALAAAGRRVCLVDACFAAPSQYYFFGLQAADVQCAFNQYLWQQCPANETVIDGGVYLRQQAAVTGELLLVTASPHYDAILRILREGVSVDRLGDGMLALLDQLQPDVMIIDAPSGLDEPTTLLISLADLLLIVLRPDQKDFLGTGVLVDVADKLEVPDVQLLINQVPSSYDLDQVAAEAAATYSHPVALTLPYVEEIARIASAGMFVLQEPEHSAARRIKQVAGRLA